MTPHEETLRFANSMPMWVYCVIVVALVFTQACIFIWIGEKYASSCGITAADKQHSIKSGLITTLGPALSIFVVGLGLISNIGAPLTLARLSVVGNAAYEASAAEIAATMFGTSINADSYSKLAFVASVWVMNLGAACMLISTLLFLKPLQGMTQKITQKSHVGVLIGISASLASFAYFSVDFSYKNSSDRTAVIAGFLSMCVFEAIAKKMQKKWVKEWALAFSIVIAVIVTMIFNGR